MNLENETISNWKENHADKFSIFYERLYYTEDCVSKDCVHDNTKLKQVNPVKYYS